MHSIARYSQVPIRCDARPKKKKGLLCRTLDGETVILKKDGVRCFLLTQTASYIWRLSDGRNSIKSLAGSLSQKYGIKTITAIKDTQRLLACLQKQDLIDCTKKLHPAKGGIQNLPYEVSVVRKVFYTFLYHKK